ncbi:hypothetical protein G1C94_0750 [Bifidobacterium sp. DSM 109963]|uniref:Transposase n=2 Tax=Bifidobacterium panos TaxID=2675321 RepID=A0ABX1SYY9_9BIFI|nr:hypothetical protein [Bifidobacterium sp. DSM 109963]
MGEPQVFTSGQRAYLSSLAAVDSIDASSRIRYADWFRVECMRRYKEGEKPAALFREAGLDPKIVGYKRIERAFARWKQSPDLSAPQGKAVDPRDQLIAAQALRIQQLEEEVRTLKQE